MAKDKKGNNIYSMRFTLFEINLISDLLDVPTEELVDRIGYNGLKEDNSWRYKELYEEIEHLQERVLKVFDKALHDKYKE